MCVGESVYVLVHLLVRQRMCACVGELACVGVLVSQCMCVCVHVLVGELVCCCCGELARELVS